MANGDSGNVSVLLGNGDGSFQSAVNYGAGDGPSSVAIGDLNGDGDLDLAVANLVSGNVSILINTGGYQNPIAEIIGTWSSGIWYWDVAKSKWTKMCSGVPSGDIAAGDFTGDGKADVASIWSSGLWFQDGDTLGWTQVYHTAPDRIAAGDITGDGVDEIIGCGGAWGKGVWYRDVANGTWHNPWSGPPDAAVAGNFPPNDTPDGPIAAGDVTGDGKADMISCWDSGLWYQDGATFVGQRYGTSTL